MAYQLEGSMVEVCTCNVLCPCWVGEDPDGGACDAVVAWQINQGTINGLDVSGLTLANLLHIPGNFLKGNVRAAIYVDDAASPQQQEALVNVWTGKLGGPRSFRIPLRSPRVLPACLPTWARPPRLR